MDADSGRTLAAGGRATSTGAASSGGSNVGPTGEVTVDGSAMQGKQFSTVS
jgi:hypothetical protein